MEKLLRKSSRTLILPYSKPLAFSNKLYEERWPQKRRFPGGAAIKKAHS
jgi:hypothetical protein